MDGVVNIDFLTEDCRECDCSGGAAEPRGEPPPQGRRRARPEDEDFKFVVDPPEGGACEPAL
eukprot:2606100-Lingulodinium_polyedra.AAC.1